MKRLLIASLISGLFANTAYAETKHVKKRQAESPAQAAYMADQLVSKGFSQKEPLYLLAAAALYRDRVVGNATPEGKQAIQAIVDQAVELANGNDAIARLGDDIVNIKSRAILASINEKGGRLAPGQRIVFKAEFEGGNDTSVSLVLDPNEIGKSNRKDVDLDLFVRDAEGRDICALQGPGVPEYCGWTPRQQGIFQIELVNVGKVEAPYRLYFDK